MKLYWLIRYFVYKIKRQLGFITKWERKDPQALSGDSWEYCMFVHSMRGLKCNLGEKISEILRQIAISNYENLPDSAIVPDWIPDNEVTDYLKFREQFGKDFDKRWHNMHKRF